MIKTLKQIYRSTRRYLLSKKRKYLLNKIKKYPRYQSGRTQISGFNIDYADPCTFVEGFYEIFKTEIYRFNSNNISPKIIDCGANIGLATLYFKKIFPKANITSIEPDPDIFNILSKNIKNNNLNNIKLINKAVWKENTTLSFIQEGGFSGRISQSLDQKLVEVHTIDLKILLKDKVDFLKIDIEGAENEVMFHIQENLNNVRYLFLEYHSLQGEVQKLGEILNLLKNQGFRYKLNSAYPLRKPFKNKNVILNMDMQVNIFASNENI